MLELHISNTEVTDGNAVITWCVSKEVIAKLAAAEILDPQLILCIAPEGGAYNGKREYRTVVSLKELMTYVNFRVPGKNKIWGFISSKSKREAKNKFLTKIDGEYQTSILNHYGDDYAFWIKDDETYNANFLGVTQPLSVDVPKECFAPEPSELKKTWVNYFHRDRPVDQCEFRRRSIFAYTLQPVIMVLNLFIRLLPLILATLIGSRGWSLKYILHPLTYDLNLATDVLKGGSIFIKHLPEDEYDCDITLSYLIRSFWALPFMPLVMIFFALIWLFNAFWLLGAIIGGIICTVVLIFVIAFIQSGKAGNTLLYLYEKISKLTNINNSEKSEKVWYTDEDEINLLVCNGEKKMKKLSDLPRQHRTLKLRFLDLKSRVCRPFSA